MFFSNTKFSGFILYCLIAPLSVIASTVFAMSLQPVIDTGLSGDMQAFIYASIQVVLWGLADVVFAFFESAQRQQMKVDYTRRLRCHYFNQFFSQRIDYFLENDSTSYLSKLTVDTEVIAEKYCDSLLRIYKALWSLLISVIAIVSTRWELAVYAVIFSFLSINLPKVFQKRADSAEQDYLAANKEHLAKAQESIQNYLLIRLHHLVKAQMKKYERVVSYVAHKDTIRKHRALAVDSIASGISELSFVMIVVFAMFLVVTGKLSVGYVMSVSQLLGGSQRSFFFLSNGFKSVGSHQFLL